MTEQVALQVVVEALNMAMLKGCFGVIENSNITKSLDVLDKAINKDEKKQ